MRESTASTEQKGALTGVRILDLSSVVSGPMAAVILADQGADVIKIEPPGWGDGIRGLGASRNGLSAIFSMINRNKRSLAINLKHPAGKALILKLIPTADVLLQNYRPGKMAKLGLDYETVKALNPELIYTSINGMGDVGPYAGQKVYDYVIQGISGLLEAQSATDKPALVRTIIYDKVTALTAAQGISSALYAREKLNQRDQPGGQHLQLSMLDAGIYFNWPDLMWNHSFKGDGVMPAPDLAEMVALNHTKDGAIVSHPLGADCADYSTEKIVDLFVKNDIPVSKVNSRAEVIDDPQVKAMGVLQDIEHPRGGAMRQPRAPVIFSTTPSAIRSHSAEIGQHTVEILSELGLDIDAMRKLAQDGAIG